MICIECLVLTMLTLDVYCVTCVCVGDNVGRNLKAYTLVYYNPYHGGTYKSTPILGNSRALKSKP